MSWPLQGASTGAADNRLVNGSRWFIRAERAVPLAAGRPGLLVSRVGGDGIRLDSSLRAAWRTDAMTPAGIAQLASDEGEELFPFDDSTGGRIMRGPSGGNVTIGIGRNLSSSGITAAEVQVLFANDIAWCEATLEVSGLGVLRNSQPVWWDVLVMVEFNTGDAMGFHQMLSAMEAGNASEAADQLLASSAARELPTRYSRMATAIRAGSW